MKIIKIFINFILLSIFILLAAGAFIWFYKPEIITDYYQKEDYSRNLYEEARNFQLNNDYKTAYYTYNKISRKYKAYDVVLFQQALCAAAIEDEPHPIEKYKKLLKSYPDSQLTSLASYNLGQAFVRSKQEIHAEKQFLYTINNFPGTDFALGSFYYLGELNKSKNKELAAQYWLKYIALAPSGKFALNSYDGLQSLQHCFSDEDKKHAAIALFMQQEYKEALSYFNQLPEKEVWYYKAMCHKFMDNRNEARALLAKGIRCYLNNSFDRAKAEKAMLAYVELSNNAMEKSWSDILGWASTTRDFALFQKAQLTSLKKAKYLYEEIVKNYADGDFASESLWNLFWDEYDSGNYDKALKLAQKHILAYENTKASPAIHFWLGKTYEKKNSMRKAKDSYKTVLEKFPDSYYAFRAQGRLNALNGRVDTGWETDIQNILPVEEIKTEMPYSYEEITEKHGTQAAEMMRLGDYETAMLFIKDDPFLESWIKHYNGVITNSIVTARNGMNALTDKPDSRDPKWKLIYPVYYAEEINNNADYNNLDPILVLSLLKEESYFNSYAVSSSNAQGLMQILPGTARDIVRWKGFASHAANSLFIPEINIKLGTAYIGHTRDIFDGNMLFSVAAYNGGPGSVKKWLKALPHDDLDRFIENIPYSQTKNYVKKVFGSYWNYKRIYGFNS